MLHKYPYQVGDEPVPGYRLVKFLGKGNFGEVWQAKAPGGTSAAVKVIPDLGGPQAHKEFRALGIIKNLHHPNLVPINAVWLKDSDGSLLDDSMAADDQLPDAVRDISPLQTTVVVPYPMGDLARCELIIAMGLGHKSLNDRLEECRAADLPGIPHGELLEYMEEAAKAIDYLNHDSFENGVRRAGVQHCDIKPHNIIIAGSAAQVCDFGLARVSGEVRTTSSLTATVAYAAPECLENGGNPSAASDQYSLAITYYELRTGTLPYDEETLVCVMRSSREGRLNFGRATAAEQVVLRRATSRAPSLRYPTALSMVRELRSAVDADLNSTRRVEPEVPLASPRPWQSRKSQAGLAALVVGALLGWFGVTQMWPDDHSAQTPPSERQQPGGTAAGGAERSTAGDGARSGRGSAEQPDPDGAGRKMLAHAREHRLNGNLAVTIADCDTVLHRFPKLAAEAYCERAAAYRDQGNSAGAIKDLDESIRLKPQNPLAYSRRGHIYLTIRDFENAQRDLDQAIRQEPNDIDRLNRAIVYSATGRLDQALAELQDLIQRDPGNADAHYQRGLIYRDQMNYPAAVTDLREAVRLEPEHANALASLAMLLASSPAATPASAAEGIPLATKACELTKHRDPIHLDALAAVLAKTGDFSRAVSLAETVVELSKGSPDETTYRQRLDQYRAGRPFELPSPSAP